MAPKKPAKKQKVPNFLTDYFDQNWECLLNVVSDDSVFSNYSTTWFECTGSCACYDEW
jgi:hypothetical protein